MTRITYQAEVLNPGRAVGQSLVLEEPLSFWGGYDPQSGIIIDQHHPQVGEQAQGKVLVLSHSRGSAGTPAGVAESIRRGTGPTALILSKADVNVAIGAMVADRLYGTETPVLLAKKEDYSKIHTNKTITVDSQVGIMVND